MLLSACTLPPDRGAPVGAAPATAWSDDFEDLRKAGTSHTLLQLDAAASTLSIHVFRAGRAAKLGHNHVLHAPKLKGLVRLPMDELNLGSAGFEVALRLDELQLDAPAARAALGAGWASSLAPEMIAATRANMLGAAGLQADAHPLLRLRSLMLKGAYPKVAALVEVELHGQRQQQWLALHVTLEGGTARARGAMVLRQSDYGLTPFSVAGGLLSVQDELLIEFDLLAKP